MFKYRYYCFVFLPSFVGIYYHKEIKYKIKLLALPKQCFKNWQQQASSKVLKLIQNNFSNGEWVKKGFMKKVVFRKIIFRQVFGILTFTKLMNFNYWLQFLYLKMPLKSHKVNVQCKNKYLDKA